MFTYGRRQNSKIEQGMVEVMYAVSRRQGCAPVMAYEYYETVGNAVGRAKTVVAETFGKAALVNDFCGNNKVFTA